MHRTTVVLSRWGFVIVWLYRLRSGRADERRAQQLVAGGCFLLVTFILIESSYTPGAVVIAVEWWDAPAETFLVCGR